MSEKCLRCERRQATTNDGFCSWCITSIRREAANGTLRFSKYLKKWSGFRTWEAEERRKAERKKVKGEQKKRELKMKKEAQSKDKRR